MRAKKYKKNEINHIFFLINFFTDQLFQQMHKFVITLFGISYINLTSLTFLMDKEWQSNPLLMSKLQ